jgi:tripartite-type tricarboxylate transporter receptor subunit TctC
VRRAIGARPFQPPPLCINLFLYERMPFDPRSAFAPISVLAVAPNALVASLRLDARDARALVAHAKACPGELSYGSQGVGTTPHLTGAVLASAAGIDVVHVPYKGFPPLLADLLGARLDFAFSDAANVLPQLKEGKPRALAFASRERFCALPEIPTLIESGFDGFVSATWMSFAAPAGTAPDIVRKWHAEIRSVVMLPDVRARFAELGVEPWASSPQEMRQQIETEIERWDKVVEGTGARGK